VVRIVDNQTMQTGFETHEVAAQFIHLDLIPRVQRKGFG
jgi:hypothetical protein